jgi:CTP synthase (UTP-ammonia lyase)
MYHYKTNTILATPVVGLDDKSIFKAYIMQLDNLTSKRYRPKINIMDNQATKHINTFLTKQQCQLQLVEPHNHRLNAAKRAIQTFKDAFIAALANQQQLSIATVGQNYSPSAKYSQHDEGVTHQSDNICVRTIKFKWPVRLESIPPCAAGVQSGNIQRRQHPWVMGIKRC